MRRICYVSGSRADWGLMESTLKKIDSHPDLSLELYVTGQHLLPQYGYTLADIKASGIIVAAEIPVDLDGTNGSKMAYAIATELFEIAKMLEINKPDVMLLLGDRGEMLAAAIAAIHLNIPVVHIHGGEFSGSVDDSVRHAISKLAHYHFVATNGAKKILIQMGESPEKIFVTGAPGLDGINDKSYPTRDDLCNLWGLKSEQPIVMMLFHPVVQEKQQASLQIKTILDALSDIDVQVLCLSPNSDAGGKEIEGVINSFSNGLKFHRVTHMKRDDYLSWLANADLLIGNSSSGIIEAASFNLPVLNVGSRQKNRECGNNVTNVKIDKKELIENLKLIIGKKKQKCTNIYGDGRAGERIVLLLASIPLNNHILSKPNSLLNDNI